MNESGFHSRADELLARLAARLEAALGDADVDLQAGVLTVELDDGRTWLLNKHAPTSQIWLSSPVSGARHYVWDADGWRDTRGGGELLMVLSGEMGAVAGVALDLGAP